MRKNAASERFDNNDLARRGIHHKEGSAYLAFEHAVAPEPHQPMVLDEHYRCHPHIARWFNRVFYGGSLTVLTDVAPPLTHGVAHRLPGGRRADPLPSTIAAAPPLATCIRASVPERVAMLRGAQRGVREPPASPGGRRPAGREAPRPRRAHGRGGRRRGVALLHSATRQGWSKGSDDAVTS